MPDERFQAALCSHSIPTLERALETIRRVAFPPSPIACCHGRAGGTLPAPRRGLGPAERTACEIAHHLHLREILMAKGKVRDA